MGTEPRLTASNSSTDIFSTGDCMGEFSARTASIATFGATAAALAAQTEAAGAAAAAAGPALLGPVFGVVGGDFVAAFTAAQDAHVAEVRRLSSAWSAMSAAAASTAAAYDTTDSAGAGALIGTRAGALVATNAGLS